MLRFACGFQNFVGTSIYIGHNLPPKPIFEIVSKHMPSVLVMVIVVVKNSGEGYRIRYYHSFGTDKSFI